MILWGGKEIKDFVVIFFLPLANQASGDPQQAGSEFGNGLETG